MDLEEANETTGAAALAPQHEIESSEVRSELSVTAPACESSESCSVNGLLNKMPNPDEDQMQSDTDTSGNDGHFSARAKNSNATKDDSRTLDGETQQSIDPSDSMFERSVTSAVRWTMTLVTALVVVATIVSFRAASVSNSYGLVIVVAWMLLWTLVAGLLCLVQQTVLCAQQQYRRNSLGKSVSRGRPHVFHPVVHAMADWIVDEYQDLAEECRNYRQLLLSDEAGSSADVDNASDLLSATPEAQSSGRRRRRPSKAFSLFAKPLLKLAFRGGGGARRKRKRHARHEADTGSALASLYSPPAGSTSSEVELV